MLLLKGLNRYVLPNQYSKTQNPKNKPDQDNLGFGQIFTDHMFIMDYTEGKGWHDPRIVPYGLFLWNPAQWYFIMVRQFLKV